MGDTNPYEGQRSRGRTSAPGAVTDGQHEAPNDLATTHPSHSGVARVATALGVALAFFVVQAIAAAVALSVMIASGVAPDDISLTHEFMMLAFAELSLVAAIVVVGGATLGRGGLGLRGSASESLRLSVPMIAMVVVLPVIVIAYIQGKSVVHPGLSAAEGALIVLVAVSVGVAEELGFRGLVMTALGGAVRPVLAVVGSSLIFGMVHLLGGLGGGPVVVAVNAVAAGLAIGVPAALIRLRTGNLVGPIIAHALVDIVALLNLGALELPRTQPAAELAFTLIGASVLAAGYVWWFRRTGGVTSTTR